MNKYGMHSRANSAKKSWLTSEFHWVAIMPLNLARMSSEGKKSFHVFIQINRNLYFNIGTLKRNIKIFSIFHERKKRLQQNSGVCFNLTTREQIWLPRAQRTWHSLFKKVYLLSTMPPDDLNCKMDSCSYN